MSVTVTDDDTPKLTLSLEKVSLTEGVGLDGRDEATATYTVALATQPSGDVRVDVTSNDPNIATVNPESLTFIPGDWNTEQSLTITSVPDMVANDGRSVRMTHVAHGGGYNGVTAETEVTITDDDMAELMVVEHSDGVTASEDDTDTDTDTDTVAVSLMSEPTSTVRVTVRSADPKIAKVRTGSVLTAVTSTTLTFTAINYNIAQTVIVVGVNDDVESSDGRTVDIAFRASGGGYTGVTREIEATVTDNDDNSSGITITPSTNVRVDENNIDATETYTVRLDPAPTSTVRVTVRSADPKIAKVRTGSGTATTSITLTFTATNTDQTVTVVGVNDDVAADRSVTITHTTSGALGADKTGKHNIKVTVNNVADTAAVTIDDSGLKPIKENGGRDTYSVKLGSEPTSNVIVRVLNSSPKVATVSPQSLTFTPRSWKTPRTVIVTSMNDDVDTRNRRTTIAHYIVMGDAAEYNTLAVAYNAAPGDHQVIVTVTDDDDAGLTVTPESLIISQGRTDTFTVKLNTEPVSSVTVTAENFDSSIVAVSPTSRIFTSADWHTPKVFTVIGEVSSGHDPY